MELENIILGAFCQCAAWRKSRRFGSHGVRLLSLLIKPKWGKKTVKIDDAGNKQNLESVLSSTIKFGIDWTRIQESKC